MIENFEIDLTGYTSDSELESTRGVPPGKYHAVYTSAEEDTSAQTRCVLLKFHICAGTNPDGIGLVHTEKLFCTPKNKQRVGLFARRLGLVSPEDLGRLVTINWHAGYQRQVVIEIFEDEYDAKDKQGNLVKDGDGKQVRRKTTKMTFGGIWDVTDERVASVPKNSNVMAQRGQPRQATSVVMPGAAHGRQNQSTTVAGTNGDDAFSDF